MDERLKNDTNQAESPDPPDRRSPIPQQVLWSSPAVTGAIRVGDQDGTEFEKDGDFLAGDTVAPNFEPFRLILPPFIQMGYRIIPPMLKNPPAKVSTQNAGSLANRIVDCAYLDEDLADALSELPSDCKIGLAGEAFRIYVESPKVISNERKDTLQVSGVPGRDGRDRVRDRDGDRGKAAGDEAKPHVDWNAGFRTTEARSWGLDGGIWK